MLHFRNCSDHTSGPFLNVFKKADRKDDGDCANDTMPLLELANTVLKSLTKVKAWGNRRLDAGFTSDVNTKQSDKEWGGIFVPSPLEHNGKIIFVQALVWR